ncbi:MAG: hypothetical protein BWY83_02480 [bacterium ADurb.Bin478]|nr:MAG: hypothetical protein BWY83_02480 [bacterium ADurb.Bin478]
MLFIKIRQVEVLVADAVRVQTGLKKQVARAADPGIGVAQLSPGIIPQPKGAVQANVAAGHIMMRHPGAVGELFPRPFIGGQNEIGEQEPLFGDDDQHVHRVIRRERMHLHPGEQAQVLNGLAVGFELVGVETITLAQFHLPPQDLLPGFVVADKEEAADAQRIGLTRSLGKSADRPQPKKKKCSTAHPTPGLVHAAPQLKRSTQQTLG